MTKRLNTEKLKNNRRNLRHNITDYEKLFWRCLRKQQLGVRFLRQYSVDSFILDFYCPKLRLGIEVDGLHHLEKEIVQLDQLRTLHLESLGIKVIRFTNEEIFQDLEKALQRIKQELEQMLGA